MTLLVTWLVCLLISFSVWISGYFMVETAAKENPDSVGLLYIAGAILTTMGFFLTLIFLFTSVVELWKLYINA